MLRELAATLLLCVLLAPPTFAFRGTTTNLTAAATLRAANANAGIPLPSAAQLQGSLAHPFTVFLHYSMCTYTGCQWNTAVSPPSNFTPPDLGPNATQWMSTIKAVGATQVCLTVRHVGGFTLWPSATTNYSVVNSPWRNGKGDVVADFVAAARASGISPCLYVILGFNVDATNKKVAGGAYLDDQVLALTELLTQYGPIDRLWWDNYAIGCCQPVIAELLYCPGGGTTSTPSAACPGWQVLIDTVRALSPSTAVVPGPDGCLVNGENLAGTYPLYHATSVEQNSYTCTDASTPLAGPYFAVTESDFSMTIPGWFWDAADTPLNASQIAATINTKMEQGANLIMNIPPNSSGVIEKNYVDQLALVGAARAAMFNNPLAALPTPVSATCAQLSVTIAVNGTFDTLLLTEDLVAGQVIGGYTVEALDGASQVWRTLAGVHGKTVGLRLLDSVGTQTGVTQLRFNCSSDLAPPAPPPVSTAFFFKNSAGACMGIADNATFPCYTGGVGPFKLCPLVATQCSARTAWTPTGQGWAALAVAPDAVINVDCDKCDIGTHAKVISTGTCGACASALPYNVTEGALHIGACAGMCLSDGIVGGAHASCAGSEPYSDSQVHVVPCQGGGVAWTREDAPPAPPALAVATLSFIGAFVEVGL